MLLSAFALSGCAAVSSKHGFTAIQAKPAEVKVGEDTKSTVLERLGSPSAQSTFDQNTWFYVSQSVERVAFYKPRVTQREIVAIAFAPDEKVAAVNSYTLANGRLIAFNGRETPTRGRELTILEQLLGNVGRVANTLSRDDAEDDPNRPGGSRRD